MDWVAYPILEWAVMAQRELLLFVAVFFAIGTIDELVIDLFYIRLRLARRHEVGFEPAPDAEPLLIGPAAVFIPAWREDAVIGATVRHALHVWPHDDLTLYVGCYRNDPMTIASVVLGGAGDPRLRIVIVDGDGPTTKSDCLNRLYCALCEDEQRQRIAYRMVLMQDAEDMVDPAALGLCDRALQAADLVQLPVLALPYSGSRLIASHYADEFAEAHARTLVVRDAVGAAIPGAGVGCAITRPMLGRLARDSGAPGPFAPLALTEDYEMGQRVARIGGVTRFVRARAQDGRLIATRAYFPASLDAAVRQKTRWIHGIALQGWDRLGWSQGLADQWMQLRDRRGPLAALVLGLAYGTVMLTLVLWSAQAAGLLRPPPYSALLANLIAFNAIALVWRAGWRAHFTAREHGWRQGLWAIPRLLVSNVIAILAGRRALFAYARTLRGAVPVWDKTEHHDHPAFATNTTAVAAA